MNPYALAFLGLVEMFIVGALAYFVVGKEAVKGISVPRSAGSLIIALVAMYLTALTFVVLFRDVSFATAASGVAKGVELGLLVAVPFMIIPIYVDRHYYGTSARVLGVILLNWLVTFLLLGVLVGALA